MDHTPARILVVDDEPSITEFVSYALQKENYTVDTAGDGEQALTLIEQKPYDLYILDIMLPGIDGYELCRRIRASYDTPILFLSARDGEVNKIIGLELGADDYLAKPFWPRELICTHPCIAPFVRRLPIPPAQRSAQAASRSTTTHTPPRANMVRSILRHASSNS